MRLPRTLLAAAAVTAISLGLVGTAAAVSAQDRPPPVPLPVFVDAQPVDDPPGGACRLGDDAVRASGGGGTAYVLTGVRPTPGDQDPRDVAELTVSAGSRVLATAPAHEGRPVAARDGSALELVDYSASWRIDGEEQHLVLEFVRLDQLEPCGRA